MLVCELVLIKSKANVDVLFNGNLGALSRGLVYQLQLAPSVCRSCKYVSYGVPVFSPFTEAFPSLSRHKVKSRVCGALQLIQLTESSLLQLKRAAISTMEI